MANVCLAQFYDPDFDPETKAGVRAAFVTALRDKPLWAVTRAFAEWSKTQTRRPSPAEIVILANAQLAPITDELKRRERNEREAEEARQAERRRPPSPEEANAILARAGFTPARMDAIRRAPMATTFADAEDRAAAPPPSRWIDLDNPDGPEMRSVQAARDANPLIREAREAAARRADREGEAKA